MKRENRNGWLAAFLLYGIVMLWLLFGQRWGQRVVTWNMKPLDTVKRYLWVLRYSHDPNQLRHAVVNLVGNVAMFVPLGFLTPILWRRLRRFGWHALAMVLSIVAIELLQRVTRLGSCDVDDLLLNLIGTAMGYLCFRLLFRSARNTQRERKN